MTRASRRSKWSRSWARGSRSLSDALDLFAQHLLRVLDRDRPGARSVKVDQPRRLRLAGDDQIEAGAEEARAAARIALAQFRRYPRLVPRQEARSRSGLRRWQHEDVAARLDAEIDRSIDLRRWCWW